MEDGKIVVIGGSNPNTLGMVRSLGEAGLRADLLLTSPSLKGCSIRYSRYVGRILCCPEGKSVVDMLKETYAGETIPPILLYGSDALAAQIDDAYEELHGRFRFFNVGGKTRQYLDKSNTFHLAEMSGLDTIKTWRMKDYAEPPKDIRYPVLLKGNNSLDFKKSEMVICRDRKELSARFVPGKNLLIQEYIEKEFELDVAGLSMEHGRKVVMPVVVRKLRNSLTRTADYVRLEPIETYPGLNAKAIADFIGNLGYEGLFSVDMIYANGRYRFLEINMRHGANGYLYTAAGVNYPAMWVKYCRGGASSIALRTPLYLMAFDDFRNIGTKVGFWKWLWQCASADVHFVANWRDPLPAVYEFGAKIARTIKRTLGLMPKV